MSSLLVVIFCNWSTGLVASMGFPTFVAHHGCVSSPPNMMMHMALDWWRRSMISDRGWETLLLVNLCSITVLFNQEICVLCFIIVTFSRASLSFWIEMFSIYWTLRLHDLVFQFLLFPILVGVFLSVARAGGTWWIKKRFLNTDWWRRSNSD